MAYWAGLIFIVIAGWFVWRALEHKKLALLVKARRGDQPEPELHPSLEVLAAATPALTVMWLISAGALIAVAFFAVDAQRWFSIVDLAGFLALLAGYGYWLVTRLTYRMINMTIPAPGRAS